MVRLGRTGGLGLPICLRRFYLQIPLALPAQVAGRVAAARSHGAARLVRSLMIFPHVVMLWFNEERPEHAADLVAR